MDEYAATIPKKDLVHGAYYIGTCRNAMEARWNADIQMFIHWRTKWHTTFLEEICHPEDEKRYDVFVVEGRIETPEKEIPFIVAQ